MGALDDVLLRYDHVRLAVRRLRDAVDANPDREEFTSAGLTGGDLSRSAARLEARQRFDTMQAGLERMAILELCSVFESEFRVRIAAVIGSVRRHVAIMADGLPFAAVRERLVREASTFNNLETMLDLVSATRPELLTSLQRLRRRRNQIAHGASLEAASDLTPKEAHAILSAAATELWEDQKIRRRR